MDDRLEIKIKRSIEKFSLNLDRLNVVTEAAMGNYMVTPIIAALAGANVLALAKNTKYGSVSDIRKQTLALATNLGVQNKIRIVESYDDIDLLDTDILTNTGFNRPINKSLIEQLSPKCVIPLMWEPWEYRPAELDRDMCAIRGIKIYGTDESDPRLETINYIGYVIIRLLLENNRSPKSSHVLMLGNKEFIDPVKIIMSDMGYKIGVITEYKKNHKGVNLSEYDTVVFLENRRENLLLGKSGYIKNNQVKSNQLLIHISGNVDFSDAFAIKIPEAPRKFGYMSFTCDYVDSMAVIDLHTASLCVAQGMISANNMGLKGEIYKQYMVDNYPALAFEDKKFW